MSGKKSHRKGYELEKLVVDEHDKRGIHAERIRQGGLRNSKAHSDTDIEIYPYGREDGRFIQVQCKYKKSASGFKFVYDALGDNEILVVRKYQGRPIYCITEELYFELMGKIKKDVH